MPVPRFHFIPSGHHLVIYPLFFPAQLLLVGKAGGGGKAKDMSKKDFLEMLKSSTSKTGSSAANSSSSSSSSSVSRKGEQKRKGRNPFLDETPGGQGGEEEAEASWAAIQDDYLMTAPKINDYGSEEEEGDMEGEGMMSESEAE